MPANDWSGERLETFIKGEAMLEHLHRYAIALSFARGKVVLDIACGEGYGSNLLADIAKSVTAVDIEQHVIERASKKYTAENIQFITGSVQEIPLADSLFDMVVCYETIEHVDQHDKVMRELKRVLKPGGIILISTPDKTQYTDSGVHSNKYHVRELYENQFKNLVTASFNHCQFLIQNSFPSSMIFSETEPAIQSVFSGGYTRISSRNNIPAMYRIAIASDSEFPPVRSSIFQHDTSLSGLLHDEARQVKRTITYRVGNIILTPFKILLSLFRK